MKIEWFLATGIDLAYVYVCTSLASAFGCGSALVASPEWRLFAALASDVTTLRSVVAVCVRYLLMTYDLLVGPPRRAPTRFHFV